MSTGRKNQTQDLSPGLPGLCVEVSLSVFLNCSPPHMLKQGLSLNPTFAYPAGLSGQKAPGILPCLSPWHPDDVCAVSHSWLFSLQTLY